MAASAQHFEEIDSIINQETGLAIDLNEPDGYRKMLAISKMETGAAEIAASLGTFLWSPTEACEKRIFDNVSFFTGELEKFQYLSLTQDEKHIAAQIEAAFSDAILQIREIVVVNDRLQAQTAELTSARAKIDELLDQDFKVFTSTDLERAKKAGRKMVGTTVAITLILVITGFLDVSVFSAAISRSITRPLAKLKDAMAEIGKGDFDTKIEIESNDEIGQLADAFNQMARQRKQAEEELRKARDELEVREESPPWPTGYPRIMPTSSTKKAKNR
ncbi:MAG: HAMP domain-containing protein [Planctomycetota bacterium]